MKNIPRLVIAARVALLICVSLVAFPCTGAERASKSAVSQKMSGDETAIRALIAANESAGKRRDAAGVAATYALDADLIVDSGPKRIGRDGIRQEIEGTFAKSAPLDSRLTVKNIRFLTADVALAECDGFFKLSTGETRNRATFVMARYDGKWLIAAARILPMEK